MKAPVGLLSDRTVLRQQDGGGLPRQVPVCRTHSQQGLGQARPDKKLSQGGQGLKICGHRTILALTNNRKPRTA